SNRFCRFSQTLALALHAFPHELDEPEFESLMCFPELCIWDINNTAPKFRLGQMFLPCAEMLAIKRRKLGRHPGFCVDTVRDTGDQHFVYRHTGPHIFPK